MWRPRGQHNSVQGSYYIGDIEDNIVKRHALSSRYDIDYIKFYEGYKL